MSSFEQVIANMPVDVFERLKTAVEIGKWPDGIALTPEQKESTLQAVLMWQALHVTNPDHMSVSRSGEIVMKSKAELLRQYSDEIEIARQKVE